MQVSGLKPNWIEIENHVTQLEKKDIGPFKPSQIKIAILILKENWDENKIEFLEQFKVMLTNRAQKVLGIFEVSTGGVSGTVADPKIIFASAIMASACGLILARNHPSGHLSPSQADIDLTRKLKDAGKLLDIQVLDHIIIAGKNYYSFADESML